MRTLIVEDQRLLADALGRGLRREGIAVDVAYDGLTGLDLAIANPYDVVVLDRDLPALHGDEVCRQLAGGTSRILMLTAAGEVNDRVDGLNLGADDYLTKPFAFEELIARLWALARRTQEALPPVLTRHGVTLDPGRHRVTRLGRAVEMAPKEFAVLRLLMAAGGAVVSVQTLLDRVWNEQADPSTNSVRVTMATLRRQLGDPPVIETVHGVGYRM